MSRLECQFAQYEVLGEEVREIARTIRGDASVQEKRAPCRYGAITLCCPGNPLLLTLIEGVSGSITSQIAVKLSFEAVSERALAMTKEFSGGNSAGGAEDAGCLRLIRETFKLANANVYEYSHRMAAGGQVSATGIIGSFDGKKFGLGQVGWYESFIWRGGQLASFYEYGDPSPEKRENGILRRFIGANAQILVDLAAVTVKEGDILVLTSMCRDERFPPIVERVLRTMESLSKAGRQIAREAARLCLIEGENGRFNFQGNAVVQLVQIGRPSIELKDVCYYQGPG